MVLITLMLLICLAAAINISKRILGPINVLQEAANEIANGNFNMRTNITGSDEIAVAAQAFDRMAVHIEEYDKLKTQFFSTISHELKTPLNIILAAVHMIDTSCSKNGGNGCTAIAKNTIA
jgi:signal transduction histidine kinase